MTHELVGTYEQTAASLLSISATTGGFADIETISLTETGVASSTFTGSIQVTTNTSNQVCCHHTLGMAPSFSSCSNACQTHLRILAIVYIAITVVAHLTIGTCRSLEMTASSWCVEVYHLALSQPLTQTRCGVRSRPPHRLHAQRLPRCHPRQLALPVEDL